MLGWTWHQLALDSAIKSWSNGNGEMRETVKRKKKAKREMKEMGQ